MVDWAEVVRKHGRQFCHDVLDFIVEKSRLSLTAEEARQAKQEMSEKMLGSARIRKSWGSSDIEP